MLQMEALLANFGGILGSDCHARDTIDTMDFTHKLIGIARSRVGHDPFLLEFSVENAENAVSNAQDMLRLRLTETKKLRESIRVQEGSPFRSEGVNVSINKQNSDDTFSSRKKASNLKGLNNAISRNNALNIKLSSTGEGNSNTQQAASTESPTRTIQQDIELMKESSVESLKIEPEPEKKKAVDPEILKKILFEEVISYRSRAISNHSACNLLKLFHLGGKEPQKISSEDSK